MAQKRGALAGKKGRRGWGRIRRLPSSKRYQASYVGPDLRHHNAPNTFTAKMAAERRLIELDAWIPPAARVAQRKAQSIPLGEFAQTWIDQRRIKPGTRIGYHAARQPHRRPVGPDHPADSSPTQRPWRPGAASTSRVGEARPSPCRWGG